MVSKDSDPTHGFYKHQFNIADIVGAGVFWDFPQLGYDEEALILTGNQFNATPAYIGSTVIFFPKHLLYANLPFDFCFFQGAPWNVGTIAPPIVLDQGPYTTLATAVADPNNFIRVYKFVGTSRACPTSLGSNDIATTIFTPPDAEQPGSGPCPNANCLETGDGRFQNAGTQSGEPDVPSGSAVRFWQVRVDSDSGFSTPFSYKINADTLTVEESCEFFADISSFDFNPSIVANEAGTIFVTWSSTDPVNGLNAQVRTSGKLSGDLCTVAQSGLLVNQSTNPLTGNFDAVLGHQRWGDYSAITLDPADHTKAYGVNEKVRNGDSTSWKTYFFNAHNP
ncbi:MAG TPA: hypothetical protein VKJ47_02030 [Candidatus Binatia bacterium]|nr:hypothetical protein [Candidatus Binatia bacterium]